ncbi:ABC transporter substrate-binding protein [Paenibacillus sp. GCM10027626]|uniref:ABC transporter substrate-binding protein n=1 Tax=Paenibacillus sp. GCM10027626 TaxID=3273411 RepID=UPI00362C1889
MGFKKWMTTMTALTAILTLAAGCGSNSGTNNKPAGETGNQGGADEKKPVKIQYWHSHSDSQVEGLNYMIEEFKKVAPHITVEPVFQGGYDDLHQKLLAAVSANDVPAVTNVEVSSLPTFANDGIFKDLTEYIERDKVDLTDFSGGMLQAYAYQGKQFGFPLIVSTSVMIYNKTLFDSLGATAPQTWNDMDEFIKKVAVVNNGKTERYAFAVPGWDVWYYDPWLINGGGSILNEDMTKAAIDTEDSLRYIKNFEKWFKDGAMQIGYGKGASDTMRQMFLEGSIGMVQHSSAIIKTYVENADFEVGVSFVPGDKTRISNIGGAGIVMMEKAKPEEKDAAWEFIKFMTSAEQNLQWAEKVGYLPTHKSVIDTEEGRAYQERWPQYKAVLENFDNVTPRLQHPTYPEFRNRYKEAVGEMVLNGQDAVAMMQKAAKEINEILDDL